jgi:hypothetical protein
VRRFAFSAIALLVPALALAGPAQASFHLTTVNEVMTSTGGDANRRFVELLDPAGEPFPVTFGPYRLVAYDASGTAVPSGSQSVNTPLPARPFLLSTPAADMALGTTGDQALTIPLPQAGGAVCFENGTPSSKVHCMAWGSFSGSGFPGVKGAAPADGQSLQICSSGTAVAAPTPKAANSCTGGGGGGGTTDTTKPTAKLTTASQKLGAVLRSGYKLKVKSNEKGKARAQLVRQGKVLRTVTKSLSANVAKSFTLTVPLATKLALAHATKATFTVKLRVTDVAGNVRNVTRPVTVRR